MLRMTAAIAPPTEVAVRRVAGLEQLGDVLVGAITQALLRDVRHPALAFRDSGPPAKRWPR